MIPLTLALLTSLTAWWGWANYSLRYSPDFELYTQGGLGLYPSPIGRALGATGEPAFVLASVIAAGLVVAFTYKAAGTTWAAVALVLSPMTLYLGHAGIDPIALAIYAAALAYRKPWLAGVAALAHFSLAPFALLELARSRHLTNLHRVTVAAFLVPAVGIVLLVTPYGGIVAAGIDPVSFLQGIGAGALIAAPTLALFRLTPVAACGFLIGALECGVQHHLQARYLLPAVILLLSTGQLRDWPKRVMGSLTRDRYRAMFRWRSLTKGASGDPHEVSTLTTTTEGISFDGRSSNDTWAHGPACTIMDVQARSARHPKASLWESIGVVLGNDPGGFTDGIKPLACPIDPAKRHLLFEPTPLRVKAARHLIAVPDDHSRRV